jgi:hypothetical protein
MERLLDNRDYMLRVRMSRKEQQMLKELIKETGLTASNVVRQAIRAEVRRIKRAA